MIQSIDSRPARTSRARSCRGSGVIVRGMSENTASGTYRGAFLEEAKAAGRARIAEARSDAEAVAWAERNADVLERRLRDRGVS